MAREAGEALDARLSKIVQDRMAQGEEINSFHSNLLKREKETATPELSPFERDSLSGSEFSMGHESCELTIC
jgi:hypothetical protein